MMMATYEGCSDVTGMSRVELILMVQDGLNRHDLRFFLATSLSISVTQRSVSFDNLPTATFVNPLKSPCP